MVNSIDSKAQVRMPGLAFWLHHLLAVTLSSYLTGDLLLCGKIFFNSVLCTVSTTCMFSIYDKLLDIDNSF